MYRPVTNLWQSVVANLPMPYITSLQSANIGHDAWNLCQALFHLAELEVVSKGIWFLSWLTLGPGQVYPCCGERAKSARCKTKKHNILSQP